MKRNTPSRSELWASVVEWNAEKGYGWLQWTDRKVFLHVRDYEGPRRLPQVGEKVKFVLGTDFRGRPCAMRVQPASGGHPFGLANFAMLAVLLILPAMALQHHRAYGRWFAAVMVGISLITYFTYASDKRRARTNAWRIPETQLHFLELLGGWPGAWLAQKRFRHKCSKISYQFIFWCIVLAYQAAAYDSLQNWKFFRMLLQQWQRH